MDRRWGGCADRTGCRDRAHTFHFLPYLLLAGKRLAFGVATLSAVAATLATAAIAPRASLDFWGRLAQATPGLGGSFIYYTNSRRWADIVRVLGLGNYLCG